jgi:hypothetical protein
MSRYRRQRAGALHAASMVHHAEREPKLERLLREAYDQYVADGRIRPGEPVELGIGHDGWCDRLAGKGPCNCEPVVFPPRRLAEAVAHRQLHRFRVRGEWYQVPVCLALVVTWDYLNETLYSALRAQYGGGTEVVGGEVRLRPSIGGTVRNVAGG